VRFWTFWKLLSFIVDVPVADGIDSQGNVIQLTLRKGQFLLTSPKMIYSYGSRYEVLKQAYEFFDVYGMKPVSVLFLGSGIVSGVQLLNSHGIVPDVAMLVEKEPLICQWLKSFVRPFLRAKNVELVCSDAVQAVKDLKQLFDLIVVDLFVDDVVPEFVGTETFLRNVVRLIANDGLAIINITKFPEGNMRVANNIQNVLRNLSVEYATFEVGEKNIVYGIRRK